MIFCIQINCFTFDLEFFKLVIMPNFLTQCFVCGIEIDPEIAKKNKQLNLPVCDDCRDTEKEKNVVKELNEGLADGFVCGCI